MTKPRLLLVEDDRALADLLTWHFAREGYDVARTADGDEALLLAEERTPDLVILDWMIEGVTGIEVCRRLRRRASTAHVPIIMLTARGEESDRIRGLETGADDYVTKPFSPRELTRASARCCAECARRSPASSSSMPTSRWTSRRIASAAPASPSQLGPTEFRLLRHFLEHPGRVFSRERLLDAVWSHDSDIDARTVDVHVRRLAQGAERRRAAGCDPDSTLRSAGYSLDADR